jgi:hypothetical protein
MSDTPKPDYGEPKPIPVCVCAEYWPGQGHHPECLVLREITEAKDEINAMREAIRVAHDALEECATKLAGWHGLYPSQLSSDDYAAGLNAEYALAKLQPFITP